MHEFSIRILDFDAVAAEIFEKLRRQHNGVGTMDLRIAATTISIEGTLITRNTRDFEQIAALSLENWSEA